MLAKKRKGGFMVECPERRVALIMGKSEEGCPG
jgi:hypothetical protein